MASFDFTVSTRPLANEMDKVTHGVGVMGGAVTAMQAAIVASEKEASDTICQSIDSGFYMLLRSRLSQKLAQFASAMNSRVASMIETSSAIDRTHQQMVGDFNRIKSRYLKLFDGLDRNLRDRVRELDRNAMDLAEHRTSVLFDLQRREAPSALYYAFDTHGVALKASTAKMKMRAVESIGQLHDGAERVIELDRKTNSVYEHGNVPRTASYVLVPVAYANEESATTPGSYNFTIHTPLALDADSQARIATEIRRRESSLGSTPAQDIPTIRASYLQKISSTQMDPRVSQAMVQLFDTSFGMRPTNGQQFNQQVPMTGPTGPAPYGPANTGGSL